MVRSMSARDIHIMALHQLGLDSAGDRIGIRPRDAAADPKSLPVRLMPVLPLLKAAGIRLAGN